MKTIRTEVITYKGDKRIKLIFDYDNELIQRVKEIPGARWSDSLKCWHLPDNKTGKDGIASLLSATECHIIKQQADKVRYTKSDKIPGEEQAIQLEQFVRWLKAQRYSKKTIETYSDAMNVFLAFYKEKDISKIDNEDLVKFNYEYILQRGYSASYQNQVISAIKLFFKIVVKKVILEEEINRPQGARKLPDILSKTELENLLSNQVNIKHKAMLSLIYACGLRRSELLNLRINDIDSKRKVLIIKCAKGKKDRIAPLPESIIEMLRNYYRTYKPKYWLFEGVEGEKYTESSIQQVFRKAVKKAGITKEVTLHTLRHSYATHLLENGIDLRYIQEILGHKSSRTTEIYTHVTAKSIEKIKSPFDNLKI